MCVSLHESKCVFLYVFLCVSEYTSVFCVCVHVCMGMSNGAVCQALFLVLPEVRTLCFLSLIYSLYLRTKQSLGRAWCPALDLMPSSAFSPLKL